MRAYGQIHKGICHCFSCDTQGEPKARERQKARKEIEKERERDWLERGEN